ncbi:MAG: LysR family transcriptional regulator [Rhodocyclaceae bacterium]|nr:LysR family transcriptional regulator [Rhodocyclaceae bacterium]
MIARRYLYLIALAREKHFGRAAAACHVSASTLSAAIRDIESELGVTLVERGQQFGGLTAEGHCVLAYAQRLADGATGLRQRLAALRDQLEGRLVLGVIPTALTAVSALSAAFARRHPLVSIEVRSLPTDEIRGRLARFEIDAGVIYLPDRGDLPLDCQPLWIEDHVLLTPSDGPVAGLEEIRWADAADLPLCLLTSDMLNRRAIDDTFASVGAGAGATLETDSIISLLAHVCTGTWSTIIPRSVLEQIGTPGETRVLRLIDPELAWTTGLATLPQQPPKPVVSALHETAAALREGRSQLQRR